MLKMLKELFTQPSLADMQARELVHAQRELMLAQRQRDYANAMIEFNAARIFSITGKLPPKKEHINV